MATRTSACAGALAGLLLTFPPGVGGQMPELRPHEVERLRAYHERIVATADRLPGRTSLAELVRPIMQLAAERSARSEAADESRAAILAIAFYANGRSLAVVTPQAREWPHAKRRRLLLHGRGDLSQHFTISAALSASAGAPIANLIGLYKEIDDARRGGGFSFVDLAADRAGTTFGRLATEPNSASLLLERVVGGLVEAEMMPGIEGLPENLTAEQFKNRFGGASTPAYDRLVQEIDRRVAALSLFKTPLATY